MKKQCVLNYVWISRQEEPSADFSARKSPIPEKYADHAIKMIRAYPETEFLVWIDEFLAPAGSRQILKDMLEKAGCLNAHVRDLNEIPLYAAEKEYFHGPISDLHMDRQIYKKADMARIIVIDHVLREDLADTVFYADLDIEELQLRSENLQKSIEDHGVVFARSSRNGIHIQAHLENQFFGISRSQASFVSDLLLPVTYHAIMRRNDDGWNAFVACAVRQYGQESCGLNGKSIITREIPGSIRRDEVMPVKTLFAIFPFMYESLVADGLDFSVEKALRLWRDKKQVAAKQAEAALGSSFRSVTSWRTRRGPKPLRPTILPGQGVPFPPPEQ